jgi:hypothetical protein
MMLKPQDVVALVYLSLHDEPWTYPGLAAALGLSASEAHAALRRAQASGLFNAHTRRPQKTELLELLLHGLRYVYPVERGGLTRGVPTAHGAAPLCDKLALSASEAVPVWPDPQGTVRGEAWSPLYPSVPAASRRDEALHQALALVDAIRGGRARERALAAEELKQRLS